MFTRCRGALVLTGETDWRSDGAVAQRRGDRFLRRAPLLGRRQDRLHRLGRFGRQKRQEDPRGHRQSLVSVFVAIPFARYRPAATRLTTDFSTFHFHSNVPFSPKRL